ncbi:AbiH family protein [Chryseobacterium indoltheticum]|uniref:Bacteriophage abortive infection AbiH n=1 Tax=Chryseobacterium indoltheticum TaxID=254 RepID=A0A3G6N5F2_9FLAO|nr:AbiH family protein [Chryseobacterium indoltheticum]AZA60203.1 hypothetical protein EG340_03740 [Chryseobacterium indoltheticum]
MVNRIILIGNGFDLAHGIPTSYWDFMDNYWKNSFTEFYSKNDNLFKNEEFETTQHISKSTFKNHKEFLKHVVTYTSLIKKVNEFFFKLSIHLDKWDWVDVETAYYDELLFSKPPIRTRQQDIVKLNKDFEKVKDLLEKYLTKVVDETIINRQIITAVKSIIREDLFLNDLSENGLSQITDEIYGRIKPFIGPEPDKNIDPDFLTRFEREILKDHINFEFDKNYLFKYLRNKSITNDLNISLNFLTFNYTDIEDYYLKEENDDSVIHIHGQLNSENNPIIFGYGDELDDSYKEIEKLNNNHYLDNVKSINYANTNNYKRLLELVNSGLFQVYVLGHSCGNSDRTLLNTIFEHDNCVSIKPFFYQETEVNDDYLKIYKNISRNFNDKAKLRDRVVNKQFCRPMIPLDIQKAVKAAR